MEEARIDGLFLGFQETSRNLDCFAILENRFNGFEKVTTSAKEMPHAKVDL